MPSLARGLEFRIQAEIDGRVSLAAASLQIQEKTGFYDSSAVFPQRARKPCPTHGSFRTEPPKRRTGSDKTKVAQLRPRLQWYRGGIQQGRKARFCGNADLDGV